MAEADLLRRVAARVKSRFCRRPGDEYARKLSNEQAFYAECRNVHDLPEIFHYWSNKFLLPKHLPFGISNPEQFYFFYAEKMCSRRHGEETAMVSIGSGNCDVEIRLAETLAAENHRNFTIECLDINADMLNRGRMDADRRGVQQHLRFTRCDFNRWNPRCSYDIVIANQALHHVLELEHLIGAIKQHLGPGGQFLTADTIGRNGHLKWPEARRALQPFWDELPQSYRFNQQLQRHEHEVMDHDCSVDGFEGIRAQDILPLLVENFEFELFIPFANIILTFIDRAFGHNFDVNGAWDRDFVDRVHARDEAGMLSGELKPTQMMAVMQNEPVETKLVHAELTPRFCIRQPNPVPANPAIT